MKTFLDFKIDRAGLGSGGGTAYRQMCVLAMRIGCRLGLIALLAYFPGLREARAQTWTPVSSMSVARDLDTATLLPDGRALIAGGFFLATAELYDPRTASWTTTGPLTTSRYQSTATLLPNGKVLIAGGDGIGTYDTAELFDPASGTWSPTGPMNVIRISHTATLLRDGRVLVAGGWNSPAGALSDTEIYDPATGTWSTSGNLVVSRFSHTATLLADGTVLAAGGTSTNDLTSSAEVFVPSPGPLLRTSASGGKLTLTWASSDAGTFHLQTAPDLSGTNWADANNLVVTTNGTSQASIPIGRGAGFYRLRP